MRSLEGNESQQEQSLVRGVVWHLPLGIFLAVQEPSCGMLFHTHAWWIQCCRWEGGFSSVAGSLPRTLGINQAMAGQSKFSGLHLYLQMHSN